MKREAVIVGAARTPQGKLLGTLKDVSAVELGGTAIRAAVERAGVKPGHIDQVIMGQTIQAGSGQVPARQAAINAGIPLSAFADTLNKACLSGIEAVTQAARIIRCGEAEVVVAGGQESMTRAPHLLTAARSGTALGPTTAQDAMLFDGLRDPYTGETMGALTEKGNGDRGITREQQDAIAELSNRRAHEAQKEGRFRDEIAPVTVPQRKGEPLVVDTDEGIRPDTTLESLGKLRPAFARDGTITAGNSSQISDGAAALVVVSRGYAEQHGLHVLATIEGSGSTGGPDHHLHSKPSDALKKALADSRVRLGDVDFIEINEAFAAVVVQSLRDLDLDMGRCNPNGGAIALGHPLGASGARVLVTAVYELIRRGSGTAAVSLCGAGGQGQAMVISRY
ncbi:acetyl-CoA C-acetyltransferase [Corynebacterium sp. TAE3-ERU16]|uniref:acetyl-CoA C-acetyltransferase n=1 Tax=Corynebacterium sp. TAE3-ERU16 TaxID=2849493 RepID=UPI001C48E1F4|nr:acetyl-CoA C-acetyltransferase [Corynebacterium sp. TAE3-ERU16]MBV7293013.1 acetyl-CoA C-acetyltransferase [Corynebacterium sp. TAE3-ERU16]